jgi:hypothetical protein
MAATSANAGRAAGLGGGQRGVIVGLSAFSWTPTQTSPSCDAPRVALARFAPAVATPRPAPPRVRLRRLPRGLSLRLVTTATPAMSQWSITSMVIWPTPFKVSTSVDASAISRTPSAIPRFGSRSRESTSQPHCANPVTHHCLGNARTTVCPDRPRDNRPHSLDRSSPCECVCPGVYTTLEPVGLETLLDHDPRPAVELGVDDAALPAGGGPSPIEQEGGKGAVLAPHPAVIEPTPVFRSRGPNA